MNAVLLAALFAASARALPTERAVARVMARVDALVAREAGHDAIEIAGLDRRAEALSAEVVPLGWRAADALGAAAKEPGRAPKARLFAVTFLSKLNDPAAFRPLSDALLDPSQDADVRVAAAQGLAELDVPPQSARKTFCAALAQPDLPRRVADETLIALTRLGCDDPAPLAAFARSFGPRPTGPDLDSARRALAALGRSRGAAPVEKILALAAYFPSGSAPRADAFAALAGHRAELVSIPAAYPAIDSALRSESGNPAAMLVLVRLVDAYGPEADALLLPLASQPDAEVLADAAEALARRKVVKALPALEAVVAGALSDPRFGPKPGRPDPASLLARIDAAAEVLRRVRAAQK